MGMVWTLVSITACGDGLNDPPDAGVASDEGLGIVSVQYLADASDLSGLSVYFQNADSTVALATRTDGDGQAIGLLAPGGFVTVVVGNGNIWTYADVQAGDQLVIDQRTLLTTEARTTIVLSVPTTPGADRYTLTTSCGSDNITGAQEEPMPVALANCEGVADLLIMARSSEPQPFGSNYRYLYRKDVALDPQTTLVIEGEYAPAETSTVTVTNAPASVPRYTVAQSLVRGGREVSPRKAGNLEIASGTGLVSFSRSYAPPEGTTMTRLAPRDATTLGMSNIVQWGPSSTRTIIDAGAVPLRPYLERPHYMPEANRLEWTESVDGAVANAVVAVLEFPRTDAAGQRWRWTVLSPRSETAIVTLPVLPRPELVAPAGAEIKELSSIAIEGGYDRIRPYLLGAWDQDDVWPADTDAGRVDYLRLAPSSAL